MNFCRKLTSLFFVSQARTAISSHNAEVGKCVILHMSLLSAVLMLNSLNKLSSFSFDGCIDT